MVQRATVGALIASVYAVRGAKGARVSGTAMMRPVEAHKKIIHKERLGVEHSDDLACAVHLSPIWDLLRIALEQ